MEAKIYTSGFVEPAFTLTGDEIVSCLVEEKLKSEGLPLGSVASKRFALRVKSRASFTPATLCGALVTMAEGDTPIGHFFISAAETGEGTTLITGGDAFSSAFEARFTDAPSAYPRTLKNLVSTLVSAGGARLVTESFPNAQACLTAMPEWEDGITLRRALSHCAFVSGGFVRLNNEGDAELISCAGGKEIALADADTLSITMGGGAPFTFNALEYCYPGENSYTRYAINASLADTPQNTLRGSGDPLVTPVMLNGAVSALSGTEFVSGRAVFLSCTPPQAGDVLVTNEGRMLITSLSLRYTGGAFLCDARCELPESGAAGSGFPTALSAFNADGTLNFEAIGEVDQKVAAIDRATIGSLTVGEVSALGLVSKIIEAVKLRARDIDAESVETDALTAMAAEILNVTVRKIAAGTVSTDVLLAAAADLTAAKISSLTASDIGVDRLASALAAFSVLSAGSASFDRATVKHLLSEALDIEYGVGDRVTIKNLSADYAAIVNASVGNLTVKARDGGFYALTVGADGSVSAVPASVTDAELAAGETASGRTIIETELTAEQLSATGLRAVRALIGRLDASRIDAQTLFAAEAFVNRLNTADIRSNSYLRAELTALGSTADESADGLNGIRRYLTFSDEGMRQRKPGSAYSTLTDEAGYHIDRDGSVEHVGSFTGSGLTAGSLTLGGIRARKTYSGGWVWQADE